MPDSPFFLLFTMKRIWDISPAVGVSSPVFPGDAPFTIDWSARVSEGDFANVSILRFSPKSEAKRS